MWDFFFFFFGGGGGGCQGFGLVPHSWPLLNPAEQSETGLRSEKAYIFVLKESLMCLKKALVYLSALNFLFGGNTKEQRQYQFKPKVAFMKIYCRCVMIYGCLDIIKINFRVRICIFLYRRLAILNSFTALILCYNN